MKRILFAVMLAAPFAFTAMNAEPSGEEILEECLMEAHNRGYDIESDVFAERVANAIVNEDEKTIKEVCPATFEKHN